MDVLLHEVLRKINSGVMSFMPDSRSPNDMKKFQSIAKYNSTCAQPGLYRSDDSPKKFRIC